jgi:hypothetical protein
VLQSEIACIGEEILKNLATVFTGLRTEGVPFIAGCRPLLTVAGASELISLFVNHAIEPSDSSQLFDCPDAIADSGNGRADAVHGGLLSPLVRAEAAKKRAFTDGNGDRPAVALADVFDGYFPGMFAGFARFVRPPVAAE